MEQQTDSYTPSANMPDTPADNTEQTRQLQLFAYPELTQCLGLINNLTENTELIPLIKGQEGSGKTTLLLQLQSQAPEHWIFCRINANPMMHAEQLYALLYEFFNLAEDDTSSRQDLLIHFESLRHEGALPVIVIDDAHLLPVDTVSELLQLQASSTSQYSHLLHIILFAAPAITELLQTHAIRNQAIHTLDMPSLSPEQSVAYITHVLNARGISDAFALTQAQIEKVARASRGLPGRIESLLIKLPTHPTTPQKPTEKSGFKLLLEGLPIMAIIGTVALISVISVILLFQDNINDVFDEVSSNMTHSEKITTAKSSEITVELPVLAKAEPETKAQPQTITPVEELEPILEIPEQPVPVAITIDEPETQSTNALMQEPPILETDTYKELPEKPPVSLKPTAKAKADAVAIVTEPISTSELIPEITEEPPAAPTPTPKPKPVAPPKIAKKVLKREAWLLSQKPTSYTLQIVGLKDEASLHEYIERHKLTGELAYFKTSRNGQPWYPLLYGNYPGRSVAMTAQVKLSAKLRQKDIWIRNMVSVHTEINAQK
ncbi:SPOR domain-containing protein [Pseudomonadota bacterium]